MMILACATTSLLYFEKTLFLTKIKKNNLGEESVPYSAQKKKSMTDIHTKKDKDKRMAMTMQGFESNASGKNQGFIQDVINFIDQPLSPQSLHKLKKSCKTQGFAGAADEAALAAYHTQQTQQGGVGVGVGTPALAPALSGAVTATADTTGLAVLFPMGTEIEAQHLTNTTEFNGLRGTVVGHVDEKVLVSFHGGSGQVFDIPSYNLRVVASSPRQQSLPTERAPTHETYAPQYPTQTQESITLHAKLRWYGRVVGFLVVCTMLFVLRAFRTASKTMSGESVDDYELEHSESLQPSRKWLASLHITTHPIYFDSM